MKLHVLIAGGKLIRDKRAIFATDLRNPIEVILASSKWDLVRRVQHVHEANTKCYRRSDSIRPVLRFDADVLARELQETAGRYV